MTAPTIPPVPVAEGEGSAFTRLHEVPRFDLYCRADAIGNRSLVEVPRLLASAFRLPWPVAVTAQAWDEVIGWPTEGTDLITAEQLLIDVPTESGRIAEVLHAAAHAYYTDVTRAHVQRFTIWRVSPEHPTTRATPVRMTFTLHPGDFGETVATIARAATCRAGWFHLTRQPWVRYEAAAFTRRAGRLSPVVTPEVLDEILAHATDITEPPGVEIHPVADGVIHLSNGGTTYCATLAPNSAGLYELAGLGWPTVSTPDEPQPVKW